MFRTARWAVALVLAMVSVAPAVPRRVSRLDLPGDASVRAMASMGSLAFVGLTARAGDELVAVDLTEPLQPTVAWTREVGADVNGIEIVGGVVALATSDDAAELRLVDPVTSAWRGAFDAPGIADGMVVRRDDLRPLVWLATEPAADGGGAFLLDAGDLSTIARRDVIGSLRGSPPDPTSRGYFAGGPVVARARVAFRPDLTVLAVDGTPPSLHVVSDLDDVVAIPDANGDGTHHLACIGDSNTFMLLDKNPGSWCHAVQRRVWHPATIVRNHGALGGTIAPAPTAEAFQQLTDAIADGADMVVAAFGGNDVLAFSPDAIVVAAQSFVASATAAGVTPLLATPVRRDDLPDTDALIRIGETSALMRATFSPATLVDFNAVVGPDGIAPDRTHVGPGGVMATAALVLDRIVSTPVVADVTRCRSESPIRAARMRVARLHTPAGDERITFSAGVSSDVASIDPRATGVEVMVVGASGAILFARTIPPGAGWRTSRQGNVFAWRDAALRLEVATRRRQSGVRQVRMTAAGVAVPIAATDLPLSLAIKLDPTGGTCAVARFPGAGESCRRGSRAARCG